MGYAFVYGIEKTMNPTVSVIIPAYNCEKTIGFAIKALQNQTLASLQIIVVDDGSTDKTAIKIKSFPKVTYVYQGNSGPAAARNSGAKIAKGEFIFFTDSDCLARPDWLESAMKGFTDDTVAVVCGSYGIANRNNLLARCIHEEIRYRHLTLMPDYPRAFGSYNFGIRRKIFFDLKGFDEKFRYASGEDNDLSYKVINAGYKIYFSRASLVDHFHTGLTKKYLKEQFRHGFWRVKMYRKHPHMMKGDDYTFWKDIAEMAFVGLAISTLLAIILMPAFVYLFFVVLCIHIGIEVYYGLCMIKDVKSALFYAWVMLLRSFARFFGFFLGVLAVLRRK